MAGTVSAGAYTARVVDYLVEVLDKWEVLKENSEFVEKLPSHNIKIEVLSGASAGGMTACISSVSLHLKEKIRLILKPKKLTAGKTGFIIRGLISGMEAKP